MVFALLSKALTVQECDATKALCLFNCRVLKKRLRSLQRAIQLTVLHNFTFIKMKCSINRQFEKKQ